MRDGRDGSCPKKSIENRNERRRSGACADEAPECTFDVHEDARSVRRQPWRAQRFLDGFRESEK
jgi:hypothetical protein